MTTYNLSANEKGRIVVEEKEEGLRYDEGKIRLDLIPPEWIWGLGQVLTVGAIKYAERNWEKGMKWSRVVGSLLRHVYKFIGGERYDKDTGCHHMYMAAWNCCTLATYDTRGVGENDLPGFKKAPLDASLVENPISNKPGSFVFYNKEK